MNLFDASALLCFLQGEAGADVVERELLVGGSCSAANWSETAQKLLAHDGDWDLARGLLLGYGLTMEPVQAADAELAARLWRAWSGLSLGDRLCLATARRLDATVWTADTAWGTSETIRQVRGPTADATGPGSPRNRAPLRTTPLLRSLSARSDRR